jgi:hypothetical protein
MDTLDYTKKIYKVNKFLGADDYLRDTLNPTERGDLAEYCRFNVELGSVTKAPILGYATGTSEAGSADTKIDTFYRHYNLSAAIPSGKWYAVCDGDWKTYDSSTDTWSDISTAPATGEKGRMVTYNDQLYMFSQSTNPLKLVVYGAGTRASEACELGSCYAYDASVAGNPNGAYFYAITFTVGGSEIVNGAVSNTVTVVNSQIQLEGIPVGVAGTTARNIYRTTAGGGVGTLALVATIADNSTTSYTDNVADGALGAAMPAVTDDIPTPEFVCIHKNRMFFTGEDTNLNRIWYSAINAPEYVQTTTSVVYYEEISPDDNDRIMQIVSFADNLVIFKRNSVRILYTQGPQDQWSLSDVRSPVGTVASDSVTVTPYGVVYLGSDGFYLFNGNTSKRIILQFDNNNILKTRVGQCVGYFYQDQYHFAYPDTNIAAADNNKYIVYDMGKDTLSVEPRNFNWFYAALGATDTGDLYYSDSTAGYIYGPYKTTRELIYDTENDFSLGDNDDTNHIMGTPTNPKIQISWDPDTERIQDTAIVISTLTTQTILTREHTSGTYTSPAAQVNAGTLGSMYWYEEIDSFYSQDVLFYVRTATTEAGLAAAPWSSSMSSPGGSSMVTAGATARDWLQWKVDFSTSTAGYTPYVYRPDNTDYAVRLTYDETANPAETDLTMRWRSGWRNLEAPEIDKIFQKVILYYYTDATTGTLTFFWEVRGRGETSGSINIDLEAYPKRYECFLPQEAYGKELRFTLQNSNITTETLTIKEVSIVWAALPMII